MNVDVAERARQWFTRMWAARDRALAAQWLAPNVRGESAGRVIEGREAWLAQVFDPFASAFPDIRFEVIGTVTQADESVVRWRMRGSHLGDALGIPPAGCQVRCEGITWFRFEDGLIVEGQDGFDIGSLMQALTSRTSCAGIRVEPAL